MSEPINPPSRGETVLGPTAASEARSLLLNEVSWGAIFAGVVVALVTQVLLSMLGAGIGIATLDPGSGDNPAASTFSIVAGIWYLLSGIISAFVGGYIAARMSGKTVATTGALHGLTTWAFTTLLVSICLPVRSALWSAALSAAWRAPLEVWGNRRPDGGPDYRGKQSARRD